MARKEHHRPFRTLGLIAKVLESTPHLLAVKIVKLRYLSKVQAPKTCGHAFRVIRRIAEHAGMGVFRVPYDERHAFDSRDLRRWWRSDVPVCLAEPRNALTNDFLPLAVGA